MPYLFHPFLLPLHHHARDLPGFIPKAKAKQNKTEEVKQICWGYHTRTQAIIIFPKPNGVRVQERRAIPSHGDLLCWQKQIANGKPKMKIHSFDSSHHHDQQGWGRSRPSPSLRLPLNPRDPHHHFFVLDRNPARKHFHRIFEIRIKHYLPRAVD